MPRRSTIMVIVDELVGASSSEGVERAMRFAVGLARDHSVVLCSSVGISEHLRGVDTQTLSGRKLSLHAGLATVSIASRSAAGRLPRRRWGPMCVDLGRFSASAFALDTAESAGAQGRSQLELTNAALRSGDFFVCADESDRAPWLGALAAAGRIRPQLYDADPNLRRLLDVAPTADAWQPGTPVVLPDALRRFCQSPWRNPGGGR